jgi:FlaA1/EpsC-like NDP-sugar epimerase
MTAIRTDDPALLGRPELVTDFEGARRAMAGRTVLITGAAGSLGAQLAGAIAGATGARLILLDHHEHSLFALQRRLAREAPGGRFQPVLADVRDTRRMTQVVREHQPDLIFHFAAYKHVHFGEHFPEQAVSVNVLATRDLLRLAASAGVQRFVYPSSDKAVNPPSLYGAGKRISEVLVLAAACRGHAFTALRYVNVLGTLGSALETFANQIEAGEPMTVTDRAMTRFWISQQEAIWLALHAAMADGGALLMLDVREDVPVVEMAARLARRAQATDAPYPIVVTGARPGERLREELLGPHEHALAGPVAGLLRVEDHRRAEHVSRVERIVEELAALCGEASADALRDATMRAARSLQ